MGKIMSLIKKVDAFTRNNSAAIMAGVAAVGLIATAVTSFRAGGKTILALSERKKELEALLDSEDIKMKKKGITETAKIVAPIVLPSVVLGGVSIACIFGSHSASRRRIAALSAAYSISESAVKDLEGTMKKLLGEKKAKEIKDAVVKEKMKDEKAPDNKEIIITGKGDVLCKDMYSGRYFRSNADRIGKAINWASAEIRDTMYISLNEFYDQLSIPRIPLGDDIGWNLDDLDGGSLPITYSAILTEDDQPCLCLQMLASARSDYKRWR